MPSRWPSERRWAPAPGSPSGRRRASARRRPRSTGSWPPSTVRRAGSGPTRNSPGSTAPGTACSCSATDWPRPSASRSRPPDGPAGWPTRRSATRSSAWATTGTSPRSTPPAAATRPRAGPGAGLAGGPARRALLRLPRGRAAGPGRHGQGPGLRSRRARGHVGLRAAGRHPGRARRGHGRRRDAAPRRLAGHGGRGRTAAPGAQMVRLDAGAIATSSVTCRAWRRGGAGRCTTSSIRALVAQPAGPG